MKDLGLSQLPSQTGKTILITGGTSGLGRELVRYLAALEPAKIFFTGRSQVRADEVLADITHRYPKIQARFVQMDLASLSDIKRSVELLIPQLDGRLDVLICNAGIMAAPPGLSTDGYEIQFAINFLGHALLTQYLLPTLTATASSHGDARIVNTTSEGLMLAPSEKGIVFSDLKTKQEYGFGARWRRYGQSKLAQVLYTTQLAQRHPTVSTIVIHPGVVGTDLVKTLGWADRLLVYATAKITTPEDGCKNSMWGATAPREDVENGAYYSPIAEPGKQAKWIKDQDLGDELWKWTEDALRPYVSSQK
ncbi:hypothetical protein E4T48_05509 [Aureobasidium sp. EXF-10727]|nr:hypothetical protein E4T48_05509 [Aureobasidium sp. EXF-10727]KAI4730514.1 hypothetical protein E4T49_01658 [Aureobasidium sp. EXF-10728]